MKEEPPEPTPRKRMNWLRREGIDLGDAVVQFIAVLLGVLLALLISQWTHHRQQQATAHAAMLQQQATVKEAMHAIAVELASNRTALHRSVARLYAMAKQMHDAPENQKLPPRPCYMWAGWRRATGLFLNLTDAAYQTAIATQAIAHMPFHQAHVVAEIYGGQQLFETGSGVLRNKILVARPQKLIACIGWIESMGTTEQSLNNAYTQLIGPDKTRWPTPPIPFPTMK